MKTGKLTLFLWVFLAAQAGQPDPAGAKEYFIAPAGTPTSRGTLQDPWDLVSALSGQKKIQPGDTLWIRGGVYRPAGAHSKKQAGFLVRIAGTGNQPIQIRGFNRERATIDGGLKFFPPSDYLWVRDLEIAPAPGTDLFRKSKKSGSNPEDLDYPLGDLEITTGRGCKFINLVVQNNLGSGISWSQGSRDSEIYGCLVVNNGWQGPDRNHGHAVYVQNQEGTKKISNCILTARWGGGQYTIHAYGSESVPQNNLILEKNICYGRGPFLVGGEGPSRNIEVRENYLYRVPMRLGHGNQWNQDCRIRDNIISHAFLLVKKYKQVWVEKNLLVMGDRICLGCREVVDRDNRVFLFSRDAGTRGILLPNQYDPRRAHLAVFNWGRLKEVEVRVDGFLVPGETFRLMDPEDFYGRPVFQGRCTGKTIRLPHPGEFGVFVMLRE